MACNIHRDLDNNIVRVDAENGKESILFLAINSNPHLTSDQALEAYKNTFTENFATTNLDENLEPILAYKAPNGQIYNSFAEALQNTTDSIIEGVYNNFTFFKIDANTNPSTLNGFINNSLPMMHSYLSDFVGYCKSQKIGLQLVFLVPFFL